MCANAYMSYSCGARVINPEYNTSTPRLTNEVENQWIKKHSEHS